MLAMSRMLLILIALQFAHVICSVIRNPLIEHQPSARNAPSHGNLNHISHLSDGTTTSSAANAHSITTDETESQVKLKYALTYSIFQTLLELNSDSHQLPNIDVNSTNVAFGMLILVLDEHIDLRSGFYFYSFATNKSLDGLDFRCNVSFLFLLAFVVHLPTIRDQIQLPLLKTIVLRAIKYAFANQVFRTIIQQELAVLFTAFAIKPLDVRDATTISTEIDIPILRFVYLEMRNSPNAYTQAIMESIWSRFIKHGSSKSLGSLNKLYQLLFIEEVEALSSKLGVVQDFSVVERYFDSFHQLKSHFPCPTCQTFVKRSDFINLPTDSFVNGLAELANLFMETNSDALSKLQEFVQQIIEMFYRQCNLFTFDIFVKYRYEHVEALYLTKSQIQFPPNVELFQQLELLLSQFHWINKLVRVSAAISSRRALDLTSVLSTKIELDERCQNLHDLAIGIRKYVINGNAKSNIYDRLTLEAYFKSQKLASSYPELGQSDETDKLMVDAEMHLFMLHRKRHDVLLKRFVNWIREPVSSHNLATFYPQLDEPEKQTLIACFIDAFIHRYA